MATRSVKLPDIGEGVAEAELVEWHVKVGDVVKEDQIVAAVMTDKATVEIPAPVDGTIVALGAETGASLAVGSELFRMDTGGAADAHAPAAEPAAPEPQPAPEPSQPASAAPQPALPLTAEPTRRMPSPAPAMPTPQHFSIPAPSGPPRAAGEKPIASPAIRRRALDAGVDLRQVRGSGPAGRISHDDLDAFLRGGGTAAPVAAGRVARTAVEEIKVIGLRRRIAQKMAESKRRIAHFSYVEEVDVTALEELRATLNGGIGKGRAKLTLIPFLIQALVRAVAEFPQMNALYDDEAEIIHRHDGVHVGIATQTPSGLMVPVVRHAEARDLWDSAAEVRRLAEAARAGLATREELSGSTITITSLGALGGIVSTPVINRPEVAILGVNKQVMRPVWKDGAFVPRLTMNLSSSFDHRVIDGYDAATFIQAIKALIETPATLFIDA